MKPPRLLFIPFVLLLAYFIPLHSAPPSKAPAKKPQSSAKSSAPAKAPAKPGAKSARRTGRKPVSARRRSATQQQPESARIREIQEALTARGYAVQATGVWGADTVEALKKFQTDQNIDNMSGRGKLDSLTLIALGLGPRRGTSPAQANQEAGAVTEGKQQ